MRCVKNILLLVGIAVSGSSCDESGDSSNKPEDRVENLPASSPNPATQPTLGTPAESAEAQPAAPSTDVSRPINSASANANSGIIEPRPLTAAGTPEGISSWSEFNSPNDPRAMSIFTFEGKDAVSELMGEDSRCSIFVLATYLDSEMRPTYVVRTTFSHNTETHPFLLVKVDPSGTSAQGADTSGQDQIYFNLSTPGDFYSATSMRLKWFHTNHYDTGVCETLVPSS